MLKSIGDLFRRGAEAHGESYGAGAAGGIVERSDQEVAEKQLNATVFTCADLIAKAIAQVKFTSTDEHWDKAFRSPNLFQSCYDFQYAVAWDATVFGNAYILRSTGSSGRQGVLSPLDPTNVEAKAENGVPKYTLRDIGETLDSGRIIHIRHGGGSGLRALGRVAGGWTRIQALDSCDTEIRNVFDKGISMQHVLHGGVADLDTIKKMLASIRGAFGKDGDKRGGVVGLTGGFKLDTVKGMTPADADMRWLRTDLIREVVALFGIPPFAAGGSSDTKFSNTVARHQQTNQQALLPLARNIRDKLAHALDVEVAFNELDLIAGDFAMQVELALEAAGGPIMTPNQARERMWGEGPVEGGERLRDRADAAAQPGDRRGETDPDGSESDR